LLWAHVPEPNLASCLSSAVAKAIVRNDSRYTWRMTTPKSEVVTIEITGENLRQHEANMIAYLRQDPRLSVNSEIMPCEGLSPQRGRIYVAVNSSVGAAPTQLPVSIVVNSVTNYLSRPEAESCKPEMLRIFAPDGTMSKAFNESSK
jgi:hypothetical protein